MKQTLTRVALAVALLVPLLAGRASAQTGDPTRAGTSITNTATATFTDANSNTYTDVTATATVTVARQYGIVIDANSATQTTAPGSSSSASFTYTNTGNDRDRFAVTFTPPGGITVTGYHVTISGTTTDFATLAALNAFLASDASANIDYQGNGDGNDYQAIITIDYTVNAGTGGVEQEITLGGSAGGPSGTPETDDGTTTLTPSATLSVSVTPDGATVSRLPSGTYTQTFRVTNTGNGPDSYDLSAGVSGAGAARFTIESVEIGGSGATNTGTISATGTNYVDVVVTYSISAGAATSGTIGLTATSTTASGPSDSGSLNVTVYRANVTMTKEAFGGDATTPDEAGGVITEVLPDAYIWYKITVTNGTGAADAESISVSDVLSAIVTYDGTAGDAAGWTIGYDSGTRTVTASLAGTLAADASRYFWIRVLVP